MEYQKDQYQAQFLNIFLCDMLFLLQENNIASYADDNTLYTTGESPSEVISDLILAADKMFHWFHNNAMNANPGK